MIIAALILLGLCFGSFVNALVWRWHEQAKEGEKKRPNQKYLASLSMSRGRSMCSHCHHELAVKDLVPVFSWLFLRGKCRYCGKPIPDSPLVELLTAGLFVGSYLWWPASLRQPTTRCPLPALFQGAALHDNLVFGLWLVLLIGLVALLVYDLRWMLLPNRLLYPTSAVAGLLALITISNASRPLLALANTGLAVVIGGGIFYLLFQISDGKWIGGGDIKLGGLLGLIVATPSRSLLFIFIAAVGGTIVSLPLLLSGRLKPTSTIPFGPFLIAGAILTFLFGGGIIHWYTHFVLNNS